MLNLNANKIKKACLPYPHTTKDKARQTKRHGKTEESVILLLKIKFSKILIRASNSKQQSNQGNIKKTLPILIRQATNT